MRKFKAVISDIDGTLVANDPKGIPSARVKNAILKTQEQGVIFVLATGRPMSMLEYFIDELIFTGLVILDNGSIIYDAKNKIKIWESFIENKSANQVLKIALTYGKEIGTSTSKGRIDNLLEVPVDTHIYKYCVIGLTHAEADEFIDTINRECAGLSVCKAASYKGEDYLDVYVANADATKQYAVMKVSELLNIPREEIIGVGDHYNDFPLLMACGFKVAMQNGVEGLKAIADYIAPSVEEDGVAQMLEKFVLQ